MPDLNLSHPFPVDTEVSIRITETTSILGTVLDSMIGLDSLYRYQLRTQLTDGNSIDAVDLVDVMQVYVTIPTI